MATARGRHAAGKQTSPRSAATAPRTQEAEALGDTLIQDRAHVPRLTQGLVLHGRYHGAGFTEPTYIVRRVDGQVVQLSQLLYHLVCAIDGTRDAERIAARVSASFAREITAQNIEFLIDHKLRPLGIVAAPGRTRMAGDAPRSDLLLALKGRSTLIAPPAVEKIARAFSWLHRGPIVALVLLAAAAMDTWLFWVHGAVSALLDVLNEPVLLLSVFALAVASLLFHEFGHASACHFSGAKPGRIGCGIYLLWPSLFTDVTDAYRITRTGRLRTDLGGVYFNVVYMLALGGIYALTGQPFLLAAVYLGHFEILEQLVPVVRLDGYYILADLAGVPDLFGQIKPVLRRALPGRRGNGPGMVALTRRSRNVVTAWVATLVPLIAAELCYMLWNLPRLVRTAAASLTMQAQTAAGAIAHDDVIGSVAALLGLILLTVPLAGSIYLLARLGWSLLRSRGAAALATTALPTTARRRAVLAVAVTVPAVAAGFGVWMSHAARSPALVDNSPPPSIGLSPAAVPSRVGTAGPTPHPRVTPTREHTALPVHHSPAAVPSPTAQTPRPVLSATHPAPVSPSAASSTLPTAARAASTGPTSARPTATVSSTPDQSQTPAASTGPPAAGQGPGRPTTEPPWRP